MQNTMWSLNKFENATAFISDTGERCCYSEIRYFSEEILQYLRPRSLVFSLCSNTVGSVLGYVAFLENGIVPLMLDKHIDNDFLHELYERYRPEYIWLPAEQTSVFDGKVILNRYGYTLLQCKSKSSFQLHSCLALLLTTSGSTGSPKLVRQSYANLHSNTQSIVEYLKLDATERPITTLPMNYVYGLSIINSHLAVGATIILTDATLMQREFWNIFNEHEATSFGGVPYTYEMLAKLMFFRRKLPSLRTMTQAGGKLLPELQRKFAEYARDNNKQFVVMYGAAEATARMGYLPPEYALSKCGSMGIAIPRGKFHLVDSMGKIIDTPETVGELFYEGPNVALGYAKSGEDLSKGDEFGGTLQTGDMAKFDADGFFFIVGRKKRFLKVFGNRINLDETERLIKAAFPELECACTGVDDAMRIFITDRERLKSVQSFVAEKTHLNFTAFNIVFCERLPKNESGKTLYSKLNEL